MTSPMSVAECSGFPGACEDEDMLDCRRGVQKRGEASQLTSIHAGIVSGFV